MIHSKSSTIIQTNNHNNHHNKPGIGMPWSASYTVIPQFASWLPSQQPNHIFSSCTNNTFFSYPIPIDFSCIYLFPSSDQNITHFDLNYFSKYTPTHTHNGRLHNTIPASRGPPNQHPPRQRRQDRHEARRSLINGLSSPDAAGQVG